MCKCCGQEIDVGILVFRKTNLGGSFFYVALWTNYVE
jgi:hypothetical protein